MMTGPSGCIAWGLTVDELTEALGEAMSLSLRRLWLVAALDVQQRPVAPPPSRAGLEPFSAGARSAAASVGSRRDLGPPVRRRRPRRGGRPLVAGVGARVRLERRGSR